MKKYTIKLIHRLYDWDAEFTYAAPDTRTAKYWAKTKLVDADNWLITSAKQVKP